METPLAGYGGSPLSPANPVSNELKSDPAKTRQARVRPTDILGLSFLSSAPLFTSSCPPGASDKPPRMTALCSELLRDIANALQSPLPTPVRRRCTLPPAAASM